MTGVELITAGDLHFDHDYQRQPDLLKVKRYATRWHPGAEGVIECSRRSDGSLWVMDGQHRVLAFIRVHGSQGKIKCNIHERLTRQEEAERFSIINGQRGPVAKGDWLRSRLLAGDAYWSAIIATVEELQIPWAYKGRSGTEFRIVCWGALEAIVKAGGADGMGLLQQTLRLTIAFFGRDPGSVDAYCLKGIADFIRRNSGDDNWNEKEIIQKIRLEGFEVVKNEQRKIWAQGNYRDVSWSLAIRDVYNRGKRSRHIGLADRTKSMVDP